MASQESDKKGYCDALSRGNVVPCMPLFEGYVPHSRAFGHSLLQNPQILRGATPSTDDLITLQDELNLIKGRTVIRLQKASQDLKLFQAKWALAIKERERPKEALDRAREKLAKARIKREASGEIQASADFTRVTYTSIAYVIGPQRRHPSMISCCQTLDHAALAILSASRSSYSISGTSF